MNFPSNLKYTKEHEWIKLENNHGTVGVTSYAIEQLGDVVYLDLPKPGSEFKASESLGSIESTKTVSDFYAPVDCKVIEINQDIIDAPENLSQDAYDKGWLLKVEITGRIPDNLLSAKDYQNYITQLS